MAMRLSGLMSGMDTESLISQLVDAKSVKLNKMKKTQIKDNWKQDAWKGINTKLKNLQSKYISNMRFASSYSKKTTKVSNSSAVSVITGGSAVNGVQSLEVSQLAKTGYLTGAELKDAEGNKANYDALTKLSDLGITGEGTFSVATGGKNVDVNINGDTTISDVLNKLKDAGLNANFDAKNQRFFVSSKESGVSNDFSITASDSNGQAALSALGLQVDLADDKASLAEYQKYSKFFVAGDETATKANMKSLIDSSVESRKNSYLDSYKNAKESLKAANETIAKLEEKYSGDNKLESVETYTSAIDEKKSRLEELKANKENDTLTDEDKAKIDEEISQINDELKGLEEKKKDAETLKAQQENVTNLEKKLQDIGEYISVQESEEDGKTVYTATASDKLIGEEENKFYKKAEYAAGVMNDYANGTLSSTGATKVSGQDAVIKLNGAEFTNSTNVFEINGLTLTALSETKEGEAVTLTTQNDTDGIYDMVKGFLKEYNDVINEINKLYSADRLKDMEPLLTDEKEAMSEKEAEEYEKKIKDSILRNDSNLGTIRSGLKEVMASGISVNGKTMYLSSFGIGNLNYFSAAENERDAYHIDGDSDDENTSGNADVLKGLISSDPDTVVDFFTQLSQKLYTKMSDMSKSVQGYRSFGNFFDDKKMKEDYDSYTTKISEMEEKINKYEDSWYAKFAKMEKVMAQMQSKTTALSGLLGGS